MSRDVFVSYSSADRAAADATVAVLEQEGLACWVSPRDVLPGHSYGEDIVSAIHDARLVVVLLSAHANGSPTVNRELERAVSAGLPILPLRLEDVRPSGELTYYLSDSQWLDAITPPFEQHLHELADTIWLLLSQGELSPKTDAAGSAVAGSVPTPRPEGSATSGSAHGSVVLPPTRRNALVVAGILGFVGLALGGLALAFLAANVVFRTSDEALKRGEALSADSVGGVPTYVELLAVGDCYRRGEGDVVEAVDCGQPHQGEVISRVEHPADGAEPFPGDVVLAAWTDDNCWTEAERHVRPPFDLSDLLAFGTYPNEQGWDGGEREVICLIEPAAYAPLLVGSVRAAD